MDQLQEKELEQRVTDRAQGNRITALQMSMQINKVEVSSASVEDVIDEARIILKFIEEKNS